MDRPQISYLQSTFFYDVANLGQVDINSKEFKEILIRLYQNLNNVVSVVNEKESGYYDLIEYLNNQKFFRDPSIASSAVDPAQVALWRDVYRIVIDFGALPNAALKSVAHNIAPQEPWSFTRIYACASKQGAPLSYIPIPYASTTGDHIELYVDATNVNIVTLSDWTAWTKCYVILEYIKM